MHRSTIALAAVFAILLAMTPQARPSSPVVRSSPSREVIVKLKDSAHLIATGDDRQYQDKMMAAARFIGQSRARQKLSSIERLSYDLPPIRDIVSRNGLDRTFLLRFDGGDDIDSIIADLRSDPEVEYAEPNYRIEVSSVIPNDPGFRDQWALRNLGVGIDDIWATTLNADIKATEAWEITTGSPDVLVAVTDTGVDIDHPDLAGNIYTNLGEIPGNGRDDDGNGYADDVHGFNVADNNGDVSDVLGHGTQMSGIIAARSDNSIGISGISQSKILPVRFFRRTGPDPGNVEATVADAARALIYSVAAGARIINASWRTLLSPRDVTEFESQALRDAVVATRY
jgi:subtilisin family serine protease